MNDRRGHGAGAGVFSFPRGCLAISQALWMAGCLAGGRDPGAAQGPPAEDAVRTETVASGEHGAWRRRSQWEVTRGEDGVYRAYHLREARPDRLIVTVSVTDRKHEWRDWLAGGSRGALERITHVVSLPDGGVLRRYDHTRGERLPELPAEVRFAREGRRVAGGDGVYAPGRRLIEEFAEAPAIWSGFYAVPRAVACAGCPATNGLAPYAVGAGSCVDLAGMESGDVLVKLGPWDYNDPVFGDYLAIGKAVGDRFQVGDPVRVEYLRPRDGEYAPVRKTIEWPGFPYLTDPPPAALLEFEARFLSHGERPEKVLLDALAAGAGAEGDVADLLRRLAVREARVDAYRLPPMATVHKHPFLMEPVARELLDGLPPPGPDRIARQVGWLYRVYGLAPPDEETEAPVRDYVDKDLAAHVDHIEDLLALAARYHALAFRHFSADEIAFMTEAAPGLLEGFAASRMMCFDEDMERQRRNVKLLGMARRLDLGALIRQAETVARIVDADFLGSLKARMEAASNRAGSMARRSTPWGEIVLDGAADNRYLGGQPAVLVTLGGDNYYANNSGSSIPGAVPSAVLVDFDGNDHYENWRPMRQGSGFMGVGILVDWAGDDSYAGIRHVQGTGFLGIGVLADLGGNDVYRAIDYGQGVGQFGAGFLLDDAGHNRYEGRRICQGVGLSGGVGLLHGRDVRGNDEYYNKGMQASSYRDDGSFEGWGQGLGIGHRPYASGGLGMLVDDGGDDRFEGGTFSLGGGYYYGLGILNNRSGNDRYRGSRYSMGFSAHQAVGIFLDDAGDDRYRASHYVALGMAWDESNTLFIDRAGDDVYFAEGFAFGAAAMNGFALFVDGDGSDRHVGTRPAAVHGNQYHGGTSIGCFLSLGGGADEFTGREPGECNSEGDHAFFVDRPSIEAALESARTNAAGTALPRGQP